MTTRATESTPFDSTEPPALSIASANRCPSCSVEMTSDQRYCVECGTRRGHARFKLDREQPTAAAPSADRPPRRISSSATLLTGLAVLLLALGVGVMIGQNGNNNALGKPAYNITVGGTGVGTGSGGGSSTGGSSTSAAASNSSASTSSGKKSSSSSNNKSSSSSGTAKASISGQSGLTVSSSDLKTKAQQKATVKKLSTTKVQLNNGKTLAPATQKMGGSCSSNTVGCQNGKFTGNYFGGS